MEIPDECDLLNDSYEGCKLLPPIRSQHNALICWAFMMVNLVEAMYTRTFKSRRLLSVQELFDSVHPRAPVCDIYGSYGMKHDELFDWVKKYGISLDAYYPYKGFRNDPQKCQPGLPRVGIKSYTYMDPNVDEVAIMRKLSEGIPLCASIIVYLEEFSYLIHDKEKIYRVVEGPRLYTDPLDGAGHSVLLIGYGGSGEDKYWKIQNSHGENWGIKGVGKILRGNYARNVEGEEINLLRDVFACEVCKR